MNAQNATVFAVRGQLFNLSMVVKSSTSGNPVTGGLSNLRAVASVDDGAFLATTAFTAGVAPAEKGTSGWVTLDLPPSIMTASKVDLEIRADNSGAIYPTVSIVTMDLSPMTTLYDLETVTRFERMLLSGTDFLLNAQQLDDGFQYLRNGLGIVYGRASFVPGVNEGTRGKFTP